MSHQHKIKIKASGWKTITVDEPFPDETVPSRFLAYGTVDPPDTPLTALSTSKNTGKQYQGTPVDPPNADDNWAFQFDVPPPDDLVVMVSANGASDSIDPVHVI